MAKTPGPLPKEAIDYFEKKSLKVGMDYRDVWKTEHAFAFTIAKEAKLDILGTVKDSITRSLKEGTPFADFKKQLAPTLQAAGWTGLGKAKPTRLELVYDTNVRQARHAGQWGRIERTKEALPYLIYELGPSKIHRPEHAAWEGTLLPVDDPWWGSHMPSNGYRCFPAGTLVATDDGWRGIDTISAGDHVLGGSGEFKRVTAIHVRPFDADVVRLSVKGGWTSATPNHRVLTLRGWVSAGLLQPGDVVVQSREVASLNLQVPNIDQADSGRANVSMSTPGQDSVCASAFDPKGDIRQEHIDPKLQDVVVVDAGEPFPLKVVKQDGFTVSRGSFSYHVRAWVFCELLYLALSHFFSDFWAACRCRYLELFRGGQKAGVSVLRFPLSPMGVSLSHLLKRLCRIGSPVRGVCLGPLESNSLASCSFGDAVEFEQAHHSTDLFESPSPHKPILADLLNYIEEPQGLSDGAPLDSFDSLDDFVCWATSHAVLRVIESVERVPYAGKVYDLTVVQDQSYHTSICIVHNCKCNVIQVTEWRAKKQGGVTPRPPSPLVSWKNKKTGKVEKIPKGIDPGFDYNPGKVRKTGETSTPTAPPPAPEREKTVSAWAKGLSERERDAFTGWISADYWAIRRASKMSAKELAASTPHMQLAGEDWAVMRGAFSRSPIHKGRVYRGMSAVPKDEALSVYTPGASVVLSAPSSFSTSKAVASNFAIPKGGQHVSVLLTTTTKAKAYSLIDKSLNKNEREVIVDQTAKFEVLNVVLKKNVLHVTLEAKDDE